MPDEIDPISGSKIDLELADAFADRLHITGISIREPVNTSCDAGTRLHIAQTRQPIGKLDCFPDREHGRM
ncbi:hypothetical protein RS75_19235 [Rhizobium nepotum 39/7]|uniref:Uncharacterized protein n=1 Tax=Rhizobium nepotum 39/7 TaxID=1368418 RepID=A0ABR5CMZ4_9HYPH|nr:hypothetical protein RS75_19235 [Rhizobium nepotum 39/7]